MIDVIEGRRIEIRGTVQGVGFRPWVYRVAQRLGVRGRVLNGPSGVAIEAYAPKGVLDEFITTLESDPPPAAHIGEVRWRRVEPEAIDHFEIARSERGGERRTAIPPDLATCPDCLREIGDPRNRRFAYAFTNCTACGPRFTISDDIPYDRSATTMAPFAMCAECRAEYTDPRDRRFHAEPNACPRCGPRLALVMGGEVSADPLAHAARFLANGKIVAVKGLGGFHLACDAKNDQAVQELRRRKHRDEKPFAVMVRDLAAARELGVVGAAESRLLAGVERPIVLVPKRDGALPENVAPGFRSVGLMLPYTPLHHLLLGLVRRPLVMTSGNASDEPITYLDDDARARLGEVADAHLLHNRRIARPADDSVVRVIAGRPVFLRRSRGYVPRALKVAEPFVEPVLAVGGQLKNTIAIATGDEIVLGPHVGDLDHVAAHESFLRGIADLQRFVGVTPKVVAHDLHPDYLSTRYALGQSGARLFAVQHHHAHVAAVMAEHGETGPVVGVAYDGTGLGPDGTLWGGEILLADLRHCERLATLRAIPLAGGERAIRETWRVALALVNEAFAGEAPLAKLELFAKIPSRDLAIVSEMIARRLNAPAAHGVGRLFDGVAALVLGRARAEFEGQLAMFWEQVVEEGEEGVYPYAVSGRRGPWVIDWRPLVRRLVQDLVAGARPGVIAARFHRTLVHATAAVVQAARAQVGALPVALAGGAMQNRILVEGLAGALGHDTRLLLPEQAPPGDGGLALGQAAIAGALLRDEGG